MDAILKKSGKANPAVVKKALYALARYVGSQSSITGGVEESESELNVHMRFGNEILCINLMSLEGEA